MCGCERVENNETAMHDHNLQIYTKTTHIFRYLVKIIHQWEIYEDLPHTPTNLKIDIVQRILFSNHKYDGSQLTSKYRDFLLYCSYS